MMINMLNRDMPLDLQNLMNKRSIASGYPWLMDGHFVVHPNGLIAFYNYWMTGQFGLESECCIGVGSIGIEQQLIGMVS